MNDCKQLKVICFEHENDKILKFVFNLIDTKKAVDSSGSERNYLQFQLKPISLFLEWSDSY